MSQDIRLSHDCPHVTLEERIYLGTDRRTLRTSQPIASGNVTRIIANDEVFIPQTGLHTYAQLQASVSGPYRIETDTSVLTILTSSESFSVTLPVGVRVKANIVADTINGVGSSVLAENLGGFLMLSDTSKVGVRSSIRVSGTAATAVGFQGQTGARGRQVYPAWHLAEEMSGLDVVRFSRFVSPVKSNPVLTVSYVAPPTLCRRCQGYLTENDYRFDERGEVLLVDDENLLLQNSLKVLLTEKGSNPFYPWYGSTIRSRIGAKSLGFVAGMLREDVKVALQKVRQVQTTQSKYQEVTRKERMYAIRNVEVYPHRDDPTTYMVNVEVQNASADPVSLSVVFTTPGVAAKLGRTKFLVAPNG